MGDLKMANAVKLLDVTTVSESQLPSIITTQFNNLSELENNVQKAVNLAVQAKQKAQNAQVSAGWFKKKEAIELLQDATQGLAEAQISATDAQKLSFEYLTKLTKITKFLFGLGISNIAMNRSVVRELELRLKGASEEEMSDLAKQELTNVILQLKAQEDMMKKQEFLTGKIQEHAGQIKEFDRQLDDMEETDDEQDEKLAEHVKKLSEHRETLEIQKQKDKEFERLFAEQDIEDEEQDKQIAENAQKLNAHAQAIDLQHQKGYELDKRLSELSQYISDEFSKLRSDISRDNDRFYKDLSSVENKFNNQLSELSNVIAVKKTEAENQIEALSTRISNLEALNSKKVWKIVVSTVASASLVLNILHIIGII